MAYRRRHGISRSATFKEEIDHSSPAAAAVAGDNDFKTKTLTSSYSFSKTSKGFNTFEDSRNDSKGFWGVLARKAKAILEDDDDFSQAQQIETPAGVGSWHISDASKTSQVTPLFYIFFLGCYLGERKRILHVNFTIMFLLMKRHFKCSAFFS